MVWPQSKYYIDDNGCHVWNGCKDRDGYGKCSSYSYGDQFAHRVAARAVKGDVVMHTCDNPSCVNPYHLIISTQACNVNDCIDKGRFKSNKLEDNPRSKLNISKVIEIRSMYSTGNFSYNDLAVMFSVGRSTIVNVIKENTWKL